MSLLAVTSSQESPFHLFGLLNEIMGLDADIGWLADRGIYNGDAIKAQQKDIVGKMHGYIQTLVAALKQRAI